MPYRRCQYPNKEIFKEKKEEIRQCKTFYIEEAYKPKCTSRSQGLDELSKEASKHIRANCQK